MTIGEHMKAKREELGVSIKTLSEKSFVTQWSIRRYEQDVHLPNLSTLLLLADVLKVGLDEYIGRKVDK